MGWDLGGDQRQAVGRFEGELLAGHRPGGVRLGGGKQVQTDAAQGSEVGQGVGIAGSGSVLAHEGVTFPVIADFDSSPVSTDQRQPLGGAALIGQVAADVRACFKRAGSGLFRGALGSNKDHAAGEGKVDGVRLDRAGLDLPVLDASVSGLAVTKKKGFPVAGRVPPPEPARWVDCL